MAGEVIEVGSACFGFSAGDRVMGLTPGCYAEQVCIDHRIAIRIPDKIDWKTAASLPAWFMTAHNALVTEGNLRRGEAVMVQGAASGVGIATVQLARHFGASRVIGVARSLAKLERLKPFGLDVALVAEDDWPGSVRRVTDGNGVELVVDMVGGGALNGNLESAALRGRIVAVGRLGGAVDQLDINLLAFKRLKLIGVSFRSRTITERAAIAQLFANQIVPEIADGGLSPVIDAVFPLADVAAAHEYLKSNAHFGKSLLEIGYDKAANG
ncbi:NADPH:quinone reductase-like Zn-dependent oxidoreductase [Bradyrhizobium macuxiense]|uniref:NADPH:quinone reductase-like Zn-dependent oxidoreductase n=2 Tax=Bradyrhizobium macuxiense TaxID=1755647 RepID=A0A560KXC6_9BRAD|nr:NADPH:quinone reductase-like Zn-dependent oxidoreductase [Bradyrhizobium macuxiense]